MTASHDDSCVERIGNVAGLAWHVLSKNSPLSFTQLAKEVDAPRDLVLQAVGWLAREGKLEIHEKGRRRTVAIK